jgi:hypothetical protein
MRFSPNFLWILGISEKDWQLRPQFSNFYGFFWLAVLRETLLRVQILLRDSENLEKD